MSILFFFALLGGVLFLMFFPWRSSTTFTSDEMAAFRKAEQVKKDLGEVQKMVGPAKAPYTISIGGANLSPPAPPPPPENKD